MDIMSSTEDQATMEAMLNAEEAHSRTFAHDPGEGEAWWLGVLATIKASAEQTGGRYSVVEILAPDGYGSVLHVHHREDEGFYILEGEMTFYVGEQTIKAHPGSYLFGPKDVPHAFSVDSGPARLLFVFSPAGLEGLIREMGEPARSLTVPPSRMRSPMRPRWSGWLPSVSDMERKSWDPHRTSSNASQAPVRAEALRLGPSPCPPSPPWAEG
jgi:quercetin dioxygenase-like cupin family protein